MFAKKVKSYAKVNLSLNVTGAAGGYHLIDSVLASIDIYDTVCVKPRGDRLVNVYMHGLGSENILPERNNAFKAGEAFVGRFSTAGADVTVYKNIPMGAGLGGSSADAAGVLNAMAALYKVTDRAALKGLADALGSDTGYMLGGGFARVAGRGERVFPKSGKAWDIANALLEYCYENGVKIIYNTRVTEIMTLGDKVFGVRYINRRGFERKEECPQVIVATGGVSYPATGSTGDGYTFAADLGHTVEPVRPSLTPLVSSHPQIGYLDGLLLKNIRAVLYVDDEPVREEFGELGFSERGIEGAVALRMSRDAVDALIDERRVKLVVDLKPALTEEVLRERIAREIAGMEPTEFFAELLRKLVPKPLVMTLVHELGVNGKNYIGKLTEEEITRLIKTLKGFTFPITDYAPFEYAIVTAGGVSCAEVNPYTMESLKIRGLYFAGEVLDLDANTGGYNLQIAFSTGRLAGLLKK